jgi:hypothetical protein
MMRHDLPSLKSCSVEDPPEFTAFLSIGTSDVYNIACPRVPLGNPEQALRPRLEADRARLCDRLLRRASP